MPKRLLAAAALTAAALAAPAVPAAATEPAERFNAPGQRHANLCVGLSSPLVRLRYASGDATGFFLSTRLGFDDGRCAQGTVRLDHHERIPSPRGPLVFHRGGNGYDDAGNVKYGQLAEGDISTPLPAPVPSRGGRGAACPLAADQPAWRVRVRSIPHQMHYKRPQDVASGSNRGASYMHYGDPASEQGHGRHRIHYSYLLWSFVNVPGGGIVRTLLEPGRIVRLCDVEPVTRKAWARSGRVNGKVTARYVQTFAGGCPVYGWMVWRHDDYTDRRRAIPHARVEPAAQPPAPAPAADCPVQEAATAPGASTRAAWNVSDTVAGVAGRVDPAGVNSSYRFEYGPAAGNYTASTPPTALRPEIGSVRVASAIGGLQPGTTYHYRVVAKNTHGTTYGPDAVLTTAPAGTNPPPPPPVRVRGLRVSPVLFRPSRSRRAAVTYLRWGVSLPGTVTFGFERRETGVRIGGVCRPAPRRGDVPRAKRCSRWHRIGGSLSSGRVGSGRSALPWSGRLDRRRLAPGSYRVSARLKSDDGRTSPPRRARFTVR